jgi:prepilin-type processing-associated H-X9-DG protein
LIAILLPALQKAKEQANIVKCASNLRQISIAMLSYANANRGRLTPSASEAYGGAVYPDGLFWSNMLVEQKFIDAPSGEVSPGVPRLGDSAFRCPNGIEEPLGGGFVAMYPRQSTNSQFVWLGRPTKAQGVATWYALNSVTHEPGTANSAKPGGSSDAAFAWYNAKGAADNDKFLRDPAYARHLGLIKRSSLMVMAFDGNTYNWNDIGGGSTGVSARISGRHGKPTNGGKDGWFNCAFFDGHVSYLSTEPYTKAGPSGSALSATKGDAIFWLHDQY